MMKLKDIFKIEYGQRIYHSKYFLENNIGNTPLISSSASNNGIYGIYNIEPKYEKVISVASTGSVGWAFYHPYRCCIDDNCLVLIPKNVISDGEMIFITLLINKDRYRYMYGRQVTPLRIGEIELPNIPKYAKDKKIEKIDNLENRIINKNVKLENKKFNWFNIGDIFDVIGTKTTKKEKLKESGIGPYPYITTQAVNNGVEGFYNIYTENGNVLVIDSAVKGYCSYQELNFSASDHVEKLIPKFKLNKYIAVFLTSIINKEQFRYNYGRKFNQIKIRSTKIKLPINKDGNPDWEFIEDYIKSLPYSSAI